MCELNRMRGVSVTEGSIIGALLKLAATACLIKWANELSEEEVEREGEQREREIALIPRQKSPHLKKHLQHNPVVQFRLSMTSKRKTFGESLPQK